jgi:hypothetical protein
MSHLRRIWRWLGGHGWQWAVAAIVVGVVAAPAAAAVPQPSYLPAMEYLDDDQLCGLAGGSTTTDSNGVTTYDYVLKVRKGCGPHVYWHEVFHLIDAQNGIGDWHRQRVAELLGRSGWDGPIDWERPWHDAPTSELAAEAFATCAMHALGRPKFATYRDRGRTMVQAGAYNYQVRWALHRAICMTLWSADGLEWKVAKPRARIITPDPAPTK